MYGITQLLYHCQIIVFTGPLSPHIFQKWPLFNLSIPAPKMYGLFYLRYWKNSCFQELLVMWKIFVKQFWVLSGKLWVRRRRLSFTNDFSITCLLLHFIPFSDWLIWCWLRHTRFYHVWCLPLLHRWDCLLIHPFKCDFPPELQEELGCVCVCVCVCSMEYNYECSVICVEFFPFCVFTNISLCWHLHSVREMWVSVCVWDFSAAFPPWLLPASSYMYRLDSWSTISSTSAVPW